MHIITEYMLKDARAGDIFKFTLIEIYSFSTVDCCNLNTICAAYIGIGGMKIEDEPRH